MLLIFLFFLIFSLIELCFLLVFSLVLCWSGNRLVPQLELLTSQPALTTTTYSLFLGKPGQIWHTTENIQCIWKNDFLDNISHCLIALLVWFCFIPLFSFRLLCKERALCIFPEILSQKGVTDGLSHAFVMQALLCYWWRNVLWTESIFIILDDQKPCTFSKVGWDAFSNWGEIVLRKNEMLNKIVF